MIIRRALVTDLFELSRLWLGMCQEDDPTLTPDLQMWRDSSALSMTRSNALLRRPTKVSFMYPIDSSRDVDYSSTHRAIMACTDLRISLLKSASNLHTYISWPELENPESGLDSC